MQPTWVLSSLNSSWRSEKAVISVGHTKVKSRGLQGEEGSLGIEATRERD